MINKEIIEIIKDDEKLKELKINERDILILRLRFGFIDGKCYSYEQIGKKVWSIHSYFKYRMESQQCFISGERVRQILAKELRKIRTLHNNM